MLDRNEQRIVGVLVEASLLESGGGSLSESELRMGCNQFDSRDPLMDLTPVEIAAALMTLQETGWVERVDAGPRGARYRHLVMERFSLQPVELAVLCELVLYGPQSATGLGERLERLGCGVDGETLEATLHALASRPQPLCVPLPPGLRGGERVWAHLLSHRLPERLAALRAAPLAARPSARVAAAEPAAGREAEPTAEIPAQELPTRVEELERIVQRLTAEVRLLQAARLDEVVLGR